MNISLIDVMQPSSILYILNTFEFEMQVAYVT